MHLEKYIAEQHNGTVVCCAQRRQKGWSNTVQSCEVHQSQKEIAWRQHIAHRKDERVKTNTMQPHEVH
jgi:predicted secreted protein